MSRRPHLSMLKQVVLPTLSALLVAAIAQFAVGVAVAADAPIAVLTAVEGEVSIQRDGAAVTASFGAPLSLGDVVVTGKGKATVLYPGGEVVQLGPDGRIEVSATRGGDADLLLEVPPSADDAPIFAQAAATDQGLAAVPTLRSGGGGIEVIGPRSTRVRAGHVAFRWTGMDDALEYAVILNGPGSAAGRHRATDAAWTAPVDAFHPGEQWTWSVEAMTADGPVASTPVSFEVASEAETQALARLEANLEPLLTADDPIRADTGAWLLGSYCRSLGFYADAIDRLEALAARHRDRKELYRQLGSLYQTVGQDHLAAEAYRRALSD